MVEGLFTILEVLKIEKNIKYCNGCSDEHFQKELPKGCWSYGCARVVLVEFRADKCRTNLLNCYHVSPLKKALPELPIPPDVEALLLKYKDDKMPFTRHSVIELISVLDFFAMNWEMRVELFDAFLAEYVKEKNLGNAIMFARSEWDV